MVESKFKTVSSILGDNGIRTITLNRPDSLNAMNQALITDVRDAFNQANTDDDTRVIIFTGAGRAFCAGDDRKQHQHPQNEDEARDFVELIQQATQAIVLGKKPVVGAINGWAVGGGLEWAINCDFAIWAESAKGFFPEVSLNLFVTGGVTSLLPALVGLSRAREMLMLGERYSAAELYAMGLAWKVVVDEKLAGAAKELAQKLSAQPDKSLQAMKKALNHSAMTDLSAAMIIETESTVKGFLDPKTTELLKKF